MTPKLIAFDLDGTFLTSQKTISPANATAMREMAEHGVHIAFATGRLGQSIRKYLPGDIDDIAMLTLNGAAVFTGRKRGSKLIYSAPLSSAIADILIPHCHKRGIALNYYVDDSLYAVRNAATAPSLDFYEAQTGTRYDYVDSLDIFLGKSPTKIIFVADEGILDKEEIFFRELFGNSVYVCRTWKYYLEFLDVRANKALGLKALAEAYGVTMSDIVSFGDAENDIPMLKAAGLGIAMANAEPDVKLAAHRVSSWTNDEDGVAREWDILKKGMNKKYFH